MKNKSEKEILDILSNAIEKDMPDVWDKIKNNQKSRLSDIECEMPTPIKPRRNLPIKRISSIAAAFVIIIAGIYISLFYGGGILKMFGNKPNMSLDSRFYIVEANNTLYYQDFTDGSKLYSMDMNGGNRKKLCDDYVVNLIADGEYIYYQNLNDQKQYRIRTDGTKRELLANVNGDVVIHDEFIYFTGNNGIYKINKNGQGLEKLSDVLANTLRFYNEKLYFSGIPTNNDSSNGGIYKMNLDGSNIQKISDQTTHDFKMSNNYIFFQIYGNKISHYIYRINIDGTGMKKLLDKELTTGTFDIKDNNIYFISSENSTPSLYKMDINGANITKLIDNFEATTINVIGNTVYCYHPSYGGRLFKVDTERKAKLEILTNYNKNNTDK
ncbi:uncharacterized protein DUF5050 [Anaerobacterium chartisolvens]|uniref:Uncharacterized protein DUF5050 n=2 Tax=Anaerobacterium chartisolvens TaxID=1297424 RepID=A0A369B3K0_9FIRM|nr:uncharacterized protein DUF5050 [Anaerobacterium chartisolvens]